LHPLSTYLKIQKRDKRRRNEVDTRDPGRDLQLRFPERIQDQEASSKKKKRGGKVQKKKDPEMKEINT